MKKFFREEQRQDPRFPPNEIHTFSKGPKLILRNLIKFPAQTELNKADLEISRT